MPTILILGCPRHSACRQRIFGCATSCGTQCSWQVARTIQRPRCQPDFDEPMLSSDVFRFSFSLELEITKQRRNNVFLSAKGVQQGANHIMLQMRLLLWAFCQASHDQFGGGSSKHGFPRSRSRRRKYYICILGMAPPTKAKSKDKLIFYTHQCAWFGVWLFDSPCFFPINLPVSFAAPLSLFVLTNSWFLISRFVHFH